MELKAQARQGFNLKLEDHIAEIRRQIAESGMKREVGSVSDLDRAYAREMELENKKKNKADKEGILEVLSKPTSKKTVGDDIDKLKQLASKKSNNNELLNNEAFILKMVGDKQFTDVYAKIKTKQKKLDADHDGKLTGHDFKILGHRSKGKAAKEEKEED